MPVQFVGTACTFGMLNAVYAAMQHQQSCGMRMRMAAAPTPRAPFRVVAQKKVVKKQTVSFDCPQDR